MRNVSHQEEKTSATKFSLQLTNTWAPNKPKHNRIYILKKAHQQKGPSPNYLKRHSRGFQHHSYNKLGPILSLCKLHDQESTLMFSTTLSTSNVPLLKMMSFLTFQISHKAACQINQKPCLSFLMDTSFDQQSKCTKRLLGMIKLQLSQTISFFQTFCTSSQCKKRCTSVSSITPHTTHLLYSISGYFKSLVYVSYIQSNHFTIFSQHISYTHISD